MSILKDAARSPRCPGCGKRLRGDYVALGYCRLCTRAIPGLRNVRRTQRAPDVQERIRYYQQRAAEGLPLFDPLFRSS